MPVKVVHPKRMTGSGSIPDTGSKFNQNYIIMKTIKEDLIEWLNPEDHGYDSEEQQLSDLLRCGCVSGMVSHLIYHSDTLQYYKDHREEINALLQEGMFNTGLGLAEMFGDKWDGEDPLALDTNNQNFLAWYGFEETAYNYANEKGYDI